MKTNNTPTQQPNFIKQYVNNSGQQRSERERNFIAQTLTDFAHFVRDLETQEANKSDGQKARWSKITVFTISKYVTAKEAAAQYPEQTRIRVEVIDNFLRWTYNQAHRRYKDVCDNSLKYLRKICDISTWD